MEFFALAIMLDTFCLLAYREQVRIQNEQGMNTAAIPLVLSLTPVPKHLSFLCPHQDPEDRTAFFMLQRFPSPEAMSSYQNTDTFQAFTDVRSPFIGVVAVLLSFSDGTFRPKSNVATGVQICCACVCGVYI